MNVKLLLRRIIGTKENETIDDALIRKRINFEKHFFKKKYTSEELKEALLGCGIAKGDSVLVHCSWRNMYNFTGTPIDAINIIKELVGDEGIILMPCYGPDRNVFDVDNTPSSAGVLSEVFRNQKYVKRSSCTHFSIAGWGKNVDELLSEHIKSNYGFDKFSPCFKLGNHKNGKILFLGLGAEPTKISIFHCAGAYLRDKDEKVRKLLSNEYESELIIQGVSYKKRMYIRQPGHKNDKTVFKRIFRDLRNKKVKKLSNLDVVVISAEEAIKKSIEYAENGIYCYKNMDVF